MPTRTAQSNESPVFTFDYPKQKPPGDEMVIVSDLAIAPYCRRTLGVCPEITNVISARIETGYRFTYQVRPPQGQRICPTPCYPDQS